MSGHVRFTLNTLNTQNTQRKARSADAIAGLTSCATHCTLFSLLALFPTSLLAQTAAQPANQGPMVVQRMHSGFVVAPDVKITEVDNRTSALAGGYAGWLSDETRFVGGGAYVLTNRASDRKMAYGGLVLQWLTRADRRIGFGKKTLVGGVGYRLVDAEGRDDRRLRGATGSVALQIGGGS
jgi:hypothetical protein